MPVPVSPDAEDAARWWQAYQLAENDQAGELAERAAAGDEHSRQQLASWLADRGRTQAAIEVIRPMADGENVAEMWLARWLAEDDYVNELRQRAGGGVTRPCRSLPGGWPLTGVASGQVDAAAEAEFAVDAGQAGLDGLDTDVQRGRDLRITPPCCHEVGDSSLSRREGVVVAWRETRALRLGQCLPPPGAEAVEDSGGLVEGNGRRSRTRD